MTTQRELLLNHLQNVGSISGMEALYLYQIRALPRRISDLEDDGYWIGRERKVDNTGRSYVRYSLIDEVEEFTPPITPTTYGYEYAMDLAA